MTEKHVAFVSDGAPLVGTLALPDTTGRLPAVVLCHGFGSYDDDIGGYSRMAAALSIAGIASLRFSFSGSDPYPDKGTILPASRWVKDCLAALTRLRCYDEIDPTRIGLVGMSCGGGVVVQAGALARSVACVVALAPVADGKAWLRHRWTRTRGEAEWNRFTSEVEDDTRQVVEGGQSRVVAHALIQSIPNVNEWNAFLECFPRLLRELALASVSDTFLFKPGLYASLLGSPTVVIHGDADESVPLDHGRAIYNSAERSEGDAYHQGCATLLLGHGIRAGSLFDGNTLANQMASAIWRRFRLMKTTSARIAFVGAGEHATESLYPNIPLIPEFDFAAICDLDLSRAAYYAKRFGAGAYFDNVEKMLDDIKPQGVCLCGPPAMHHQVGLSVLRRGIPIFVEKPLGDHIDQAVELAETATAQGTWGQVGFMKRFAPANVLAREFMHSDDFGTLCSVSLMHGCGPYPNYRKMLHFNGIHMIDTARYLGGDFERLFAYCADGERQNFGITVSGKLKNGGVVQINQNSGQTWEDCFEGAYISGSKAALYIDGSKDVEVMSAARPFAPGKGLKTFGFRSRHTVPGNIAFWWAGGHYQRGYWGELSHFAKSIIGETEPGPTLAEGVKAHAIIEAICKSIETGKDVELT